MPRSMRYGRPVPPWEHSISPAASFIPAASAACYWAHIDRVYYAADREDAAAAGFDDSDIYREVALPVDGRKIPFVHIMEKEGLRPFMLWASNDKKVEY